MTKELKENCAGCDYTARHSKYHTCKDKCKMMEFVEGAGEFHCGRQVPCSKHSNSKIT